MKASLSLRQKQSLFCRMSALLILKAWEMGYELTYGEAWRSPEEAKRLGHSSSLHPDRLALDFNLFKEGVYYRDTETHRQLGEWWEQQHPLARWGGRWGDGNHYSLEHGGRK